MLKLFRRIRHNLINERRFSKYSLYAIGEILLVVIGILIALQINNWNEEQKDKNIRSQLIQDLQQELQSSQSGVLREINRWEEPVQKMRELKSIIADEKIESTAVDTLKNLARYLLVGFPFELPLSMYEEAKSSGKLSLLASKEILNGYSRILEGKQAYTLHLNFSAEHFFFEGDLANEAILRVFGCIDQGRKSCSQTPQTR